MNARLSVMMVILASAIMGCKDSNVAKPETRVVSATEALKTDEKAIAARFAEQKSAADAAFQQKSAAEGQQRRLEGLTTVATRWEALLNESYGMQRSALPAHLEKLKAVASEAEAVEVDDCTRGARAKLTGAMATSIDAINIFLKGGEQEGEAAKQKGQEGANALAAANAAINACRGK